MKIFHLTIFVIFLGCGVTFAQEKKRDSLTYKKWTPGFEVPDPVAISFDSKGRAFVTQTQRRKAQDLDIRRNLDWVVQDISSQSIEEKEDFYRKKFTPQNSDANKGRVKDYNGDGVHDIADLQALSERIHLVEDTDGDGFADKTSVFAEDMNHILTGVAGGVLYHRGEVFACPVPELIKFRDSDGDGKADQKESLVRGFGVKIAYAGHDMHGLIAGPNGRLYWTVGDKGLSVNSKEGLKFHYPNQGALMRCDADGSNFEVYARGLRNIQEIAFDKYGNFFGVDNDSDGKGERERFVHVEQYTDAGWRSNWQYRKEKYNPWMNENLHVPYHEGQPAWLTPPRSNYENGPAGFKYNPGTALSKAYQDHFFLTSAPRGQQWTFRIVPEDDSHKMVDDRQIGSGIALVGLSFAPDGGLYGVDWGATGYPLNEKGGVWRLDVPDAEKHPLREETRMLIGKDFSSVDSSKLTKYLSHPDQRIRLKSQYELAARKDGFPLFHEMARESSDQLARIHAIWGIGQMIRQGSDFDQSVLFKMLKGEKDEEIIGQLLRTATDRFGTHLALHEISPPGAAKSDFSKFVEPFLSHQSIRVQVPALLALARLGDPSMEKPILKFLGKRKHQLGHTIFRHASTMALAGCVKTEALKPEESDTRFLSICKVLALRKRRDSAVAEFVSHPDPLVATEAAIAIMGDWTIPDAIPVLAQALGKHPQNEAFTRRALAANLYQGTAEDATRVANFLQGENPYIDAALQTLDQWLKPDVLDPVEGRYRPIEPRQPEVLRKGLSSEIDKLLSSKNSKIASRSMRLATTLSIPISVDILLTQANSDSAATDLKISALKTLAAQGYEKTLPLAEKFLSAKSGEFKISALEVMSKIDQSRTLSEIEKLVADKTTPEEVKQFAIRLLPDVGGEKFLKTLWSDIETGKTPPTIALDIIEAAKRIPTLAKSVSKYESAQMAKIATDPLAPFIYTKAGGDPKKGKQVFDHHTAAQCLRCHKVAKGKGSNVGPILAGIGKKQGVDYLLESLVTPQAQVTKGYGTISLTLKDGSVVTGQFREETKKEIVIRDPDNKTIRVKLDTIQERSPVISTMPPIGFILKKGELRDLIAYLMEI